MTESQKIELRRSKVRQRLAEISKLSGDGYTDEIKTEEGTLQDEYGTLEVRYRSAVIADDKALDSAKGEAGDLDAEQRERIELRSKAKLGTFIRAALTGKMVNGAEAELQAAAVVDGIPIELWDVPGPEQRSAEQRAVTSAPGTVGINLDPIRPAVFAPSIAAKLMIDMPRVSSGTFATGTVSSTAGSVLTADAVAKSTDVPQTAGSITVGTASPKRVGASLGLTIEDIAAIGAENFESVLRQNVSMVLSDELDDQMINGDGQNDDLTGIFQRLTNPAAPAAAVETWTRFLAIQASGIDGLWATELSHIAIVCNPKTYRLASVTFQGTDAEQSAAMYMKAAGADFWTNKRMPVKAAHVAQGILCRKGRTGMRTAVSPTWGSISIDDIYSGARKGERYFTVSAIVGDVILVQPDAYAQVAFRVSTA